MDARTLPGAASGKGWPCRCWGASRPHRQTPLCGPTRYSPPSCLSGSARSGSRSDSGGGSAGDSACGAPPLPLPPWRARSPPAHDVISLVTAVAAVATRLALKGQARVFRPPGVPAKTPPNGARDLGGASAGGIRAGVLTSSPPYLPLPPRWAFAAAARGGAGGETKAGDCPLQPRRSDVSPSILQGRAWAGRPLPGHPEKRTQPHAGERCLIRAFSQS